MVIGNFVCPVLSTEANVLKYKPKTPEYHFWLECQLRETSTDMKWEEDVSQAKIDMKWRLLKWGFYLRSVLFGLLIRGLSEAVGSFLTNMKARIIMCYLHGPSLTLVKQLNWKFLHPNHPNGINYGKWS